MFPYPSGAGLHVGHPLGYNATDIVAEGLGTCHCPLTLLAGMSQQKLDKINWVKIGGIKRAAVLVMPRHLVSLPAFVNFRENMRRKGSRANLNGPEWMSKTTICQHYMQGNCWYYWNSKHPQKWCPYLHPKFVSGKPMPTKINPETYMKIRIDKDNTIQDVIRYRNKISLWTAFELRSEVAGQNTSNTEGPEDSVW